MNLVIIIISVFLSLMVVYWYFPVIYNKFKKKHLNSFSASAFHNLFVPLLTILAICTTYSAFHVQTEFNKFQIKRVEEEKAETMIFEFIKGKNTYINNIKISDLTLGNRAFHFMFYKYKLLREVLKRIILENDRWQHLLLRPTIEKEMTVIAYYCFYYGISDGTNRSVEEGVNRLFDGYYDELLLNFIDELLLLQKLNNNRCFYTENKQKNGDNDICANSKTMLIEKTGNIMIEYFISDQKFLLFDGHLPILDSYMRLLRTILIYFDKTKINENLKEYYLELLRAQFSSHELLMICLYSHFDTNFDWYKSGFLSTENNCKFNLLKEITPTVIEQVLPDWDKYIRCPTNELDALRKFNIKSTL